MKLSAIKWHVDNRTITEEEYDNLITMEQMDEKFPELKKLDKYFSDHPPKNTNKYMFGCLLKILKLHDRAELLAEEFYQNKDEYNAWREKRMEEVKNGVKACDSAYPIPVPLQKLRKFHGLQKTFPDVYWGPLNYRKYKRFKAWDIHRQANAPPPKAHFNQINIQQAINKWKRHDKDCGSSEAQIAMAHERIQQVTAHLLANKHDNTAKRSLEAFVQLRRNQLNYLYRTNPKRVLEMVETMGIRYQIPGRQHERSVKYAAFKNTKRKFAQQDFATFEKLKQVAERKSERSAERRDKREKAKQEKMVGKERRRMAASGTAGRSGGGASAGASAARA